MSDIKPLNWTTKTLELLSYLSLDYQVLYAAGQLLLSRDVRANVQSLQSTDQLLTNGYASVAQRTHTKDDVSYDMIFYYNNL